MIIYLLYFTINLSTHKYFDKELFSGKNVKENTKIEIQNTNFL